MNSKTLTPVYSIPESNLSGSEIQDCAEIDELRFEKNSKITVSRDLLAADMYLLKRCCSTSRTVIEMLLKRISKNLREVPLDNDALANHYICCIEEIDRVKHNRNRWDLSRRESGFRSSFITKLKEIAPKTSYSFGKYHVILNALSTTSPRRPEILEKMLDVVKKNSDSLNKSGRRNCSARLLGLVAEHAQSKEPRSCSRVSAVGCEAAKILHKLNTQKGNVDLSKA